METEHEIQSERPLTRFDMETITVNFSSQSITSGDMIIPWSRSRGRPIFLGTIISEQDFNLDTTETYSNIPKPNLTEYFFEPEPNIFKNQETCSICFGEFVDLSVKNEEDKLTNTSDICKLGCNHHFHIQCVEKWLIVNNTCPYCRTKCKTITKVHEQIIGRSIRAQLVNPIDITINIPQTQSVGNSTINSSNDPNLTDITISEPDLVGRVLVKLNPDQARLLEAEPIRLDGSLGRVSELEWKIPLADILLVADQSRVSNKRAALALILNSLDIVKAIMELTVL